MSKQIENKIVFYAVLTLTCIGFLISLGAITDKNLEASIIGIVLTISGSIIIWKFNSIFSNKQPSLTEVAD